MHDIHLTHPKKEEIRMKLFFPFFENFNRDFGTLAIVKAEIGLQIRTHRPRNRLYANFGMFGCIIYLKNKRLAWFFFFGHPVFYTIVIFFTFVIWRNSSINYI